VLQPDNLAFLPNAANISLFQFESSFATQPQRCHMQKMQFYVVLCTCPPESAAKLAESLVKTRLAACVSVAPQVTSYYRWEQNIKNQTESQLIIKTHIDNYGKLSSKILELHPYECPEIIALPIAKGHPEYLNWIETCVK